MVNNGILLKEVQHGILKSVDPISDSLSVGAKSKIDLHACTPTTTENITDYTVTN